MKADLNIEVITIALTPEDFALLRNAVSDQAVASRQESAKWAKGSEYHLAYLAQSDRLIALRKWLDRIPERMTGG